MHTPASGVPHMSFFGNGAINRVILHSGIQALAQGAAGIFVLVYLLRAGVSVPLVLCAMAGMVGGRFLLRPLELPARAADFIEGIVRAQIDRLTPWSAADAVFGCSAPAPSGPESVTTMIAATTRKVATGYVQAVASFHPAAVAVCTDVSERNAGRVKICVRLNMPPFISPPI